MTNRRSPLLVVALQLLVVLVGVRTAHAQHDPLAGLDAYIEQARRDWEIPGLAIGIVKDDSVVFARGYGVRETGEAGKVDEQTVFALASNTKAFTATAIGMLVAEGTLDWDDRVYALLPELVLHDPYVTRELTLRDLMSHRAGYPTWAGDLMWYGSDLSRDEVLHRLRYLEPSFSFRSRYGYNNMLFVAAGRILERVSGMAWSEFVRRRFLEPLGMSRTTTSVADLVGMDNVATPHTRIGGTIVAIPYRNVDNMAAAGALNSSVRDWTQWLRLQLGFGMITGMRLVDSAVIQETREPHTIVRLSAVDRRLFPSMHFSAAGLGWFLRDYHGRLVITHGGGMDGMLSRSALVPEERLGLIILTNYDEQALYSALMYHVLDRYLADGPRDWSAIFLEQARAQPARAEAERAARVPGTRSSLPLTAYAGTYRSELLGEATVSMRGGRLHVTLAHHPGLRAALEHWHYDTFRAAWTDEYLGRSLVTFAVNRSGRAESFRMKVREDFVDPLEHVFTRVQRP